jgi:hypothetical protein
MTFALKILVKRMAHVIRALNRMNFYASVMLVTMEDNVRRKNKQLNWISMVLFNIVAQLFNILY